MSHTARILGLALAASMSASPAPAMDFSANLGWNSEYIFRGIPQKTSSAMGGFDVEAGGFYAGTWAADVGEGLEIDYYGGYSLEVGEMTFAAGFTWYTYTDDFDDEYLEVNIGAGWRFLSLDVAVGEYDNFGGPKLDYEFYALSAEHNGFWGRIGAFANDFDGNYYELGYGSTLTVDDSDLLDYAITLIHSDSTLLGGDADTNLVLTLSRSFDL